MDEQNDSQLHRHVASRWTVGDLRAALENVPDDEFVRVDVPNKPGSGVTSGYIVVAAESSRGIIEKDHRGSLFRILCDWPTGAYLRD